MHGCARQCMCARESVLCFERAYMHGCVRVCRARESVLCLCVLCIFFELHHSTTSTIGHVQFTCGHTNDFMVCTHNVVRTRFDSIKDPLLLATSRGLRYMFGLDFKVVRSFARSSEYDASAITPIEVTTLGSLVISGF